MPNAILVLYNRILALADAWLCPRFSLTDTLTLLHMHIYIVVCIYAHRIYRSMLCVWFLRMFGVRNPNLILLSAFDLCAYAIAKIVRK